MYLDTYNIFFLALSDRHPVKFNNLDSKIKFTISSSVIKSFSSYTGPSLLGEFRRIG